MDIKIIPKGRKKKIKDLLHNFIIDYLQTGYKCTEVTHTLTASGSQEITNQYISVSQYRFQDSKALFPSEM